MPKLYSATVKITQDNAPLEDAIVNLIDQSGSLQFTVSGVTNSSGVAVLHTHSDYRGAPLGKYKVRVLKIENEVRPIPPEHTPEYAQYMSESIKNPPKSHLLTEKVYNDPQTTPLELEIKGKTDASFDVGKAVRITM